MEKKINLNSLSSIFTLNKNIEIQSLAYSFNLFIPTLILIISTIFKNYNLAAELGILIGINIIFTQIFSSNARSLIIAKKLSNSIYSLIIFRIIISLFIIFINFFIFKIFDFSNNIILTQICVMIVSQWSIELVLTYFELKKNNKIFYIYIYLAILFILIILLDFLFFQNLINILLIYNIFLISFLFINFFKMKKQRLELKNIFLTSINSNAFFSSFSISFANLIWRILILYFCGKVLAGIYFASFAVGSLPGTLFNNTFGPSVIKNNISLKKYINLLLITFILIMFGLLILISINIDKIFVQPHVTQILGTFLSLLGSILMIKGQFIRQYLIQKTSQSFYVFNTDILYSFLIILIVPMLYFFGGEKFIILSFFISSILSYIVYKFISQKLGVNEFN